MDRLTQPGPGAGFPLSAISPRCRSKFSHHPASMTRCPAQICKLRVPRVRNRRDFRAHFPGQKTTAGTRANLAILPLTRLATRSDQWRPLWPSMGELRHIVIKSRVVRRQSLHVFRLFPSPGHVIPPRRFRRARLAKSTLCPLLPIRQRSDL